MGRFTLKAVRPDRIEYGFDEQQNGDFQRRDVRHGAGQQDIGEGDLKDAEIRDQRTVGRRHVDHGEGVPSARGERHQVADDDRRGGRIAFAPAPISSAGWAITINVPDHNSRCVARNRATPTMFAM